MLADSSFASTGDPGRPLSPRPDAPALRVVTGGALELKFVVSAELYPQLSEWAVAHLAADPHGVADSGERYRVRSIYLDTPDFATYRRVGGLRYRKYRLRQYNDEPLLWLERKAKVGGRVTKRRTAAPPAEAAWLGRPEPPAHWNAYWYWKRIRARRLQPIAAISYQRLARLAQTPEGPVRLTLDRHICGAPHGDWSLPPADLPPLIPLADRCILELKFQSHLPQLFKELLACFALAPQAMSKFRTCISSCRIAPEEAAANAASDDND